MPCPPIPQPNSDDAIDEAMIKDALESNGAVEWSLAESLDLSFRRIAVIENIVCFGKLQTLSLSNNRIKEASNLSHLVSLTCLDLSFNNITSIPEDIAQLNNLRELSLHSNGLKDLKTIDEITQLKVLNVGRNQITSLDSFLPLRKLPNLRALVAAGNPCAKESNKSDSDYEAFVLAYLGSKVRWLDYRVVDSDKVAACKEQFQNELEILESTEEIKKLEVMQSEKDKLAQAELRKIYMLEAFTLFDVMMQEDVYLPKLSRMEGLSDLKEILKNEMRDIVEKLKVDISGRCENINVDESEFRERLKKLYTKSQESSLTLIKSLKRSRKLLFGREMLCSLPPRIEFIGDVPPADMGHVERKLRQFKLEVGNVKEELEALEINVQSQALALIDRFEDNYSAMMNANVEVFAEFFQKAMNLGNRFHDSLKDSAVSAVTQYLEEQGENNQASKKGDGDKDKEGSTSATATMDTLPDLLGLDPDANSEDADNALEGDNYLALLSNVDSMMEVVNASHEKHESVILNKDEVVRKTLKEKLHHVIMSVKESEFERSRMFVKDIVDTCEELVASAEEALEVLKAKLDRY